MTIDGSKGGGRIHDINHTYTSSLDHNGSRICYALVALHNLIIYGGDVRNAFGEADGPAVQTYLQPDQQFKEWWSKKLKRSPILPGQVIPLKTNI